MNFQPIGVFDSGVGGLTVVKELRSRLPGESIVYFGDTARVPYGNKSVQVIRRYALEITRFLETMQVKMIVVACNTASALALDFIRRQTRLPIVGVIDPGVRGALRENGVERIGVIGTTATIRSEAYQSRLKQLRGTVQVFPRACPLLVPIVEENLLDSPITRLTLEMYLSEFRHTKIETLILACTHYPLLKPSIAQFLGDGVRLIDSAEETAREVEELLDAHRIKNPAAARGTDEFFVSDSPETFAAVGSAFLGKSLGRISIEPVWNRGIDIPTGERTVQAASGSR